MQAPTSSSLALTAWTYASSATITWPCMSRAAPALRSLPSLHLSLTPLADSVFLPAADIPRFVGEGNVHFGITGQDMVAEADVNGLVSEVLPLEFGKCKLQVQVPERGPIATVQDLVGKKVVTSFEVLAGRYFADLDEKAGKARGSTKIEYIGGSVEAACALGLADGIGQSAHTFVAESGKLTVTLDPLHLSLRPLVDLVGKLHFSETTASAVPRRVTEARLVFAESGETMRAAGLHAIETVLVSQAVLIRSNKPANEHDPLIERITSRIAGVVAAGKYVLCNYNIPRKVVAEATRVTPGRRAATVSPLDDPEWVAVSSMVLKAEVADVMDKLQVSLFSPLALSSFRVCVS